MSSSVLSIAVSQLAFATLGAGALAALALCMRATVRRDAVVRYRVMAAFVIAMLLMIPAQLAASRWAPPWSGWLGERDSATWRIITHWHGIVGGIERRAEPVPFESQAQGAGLHAVAAPVASSGWPAVTVRALVFLVYVAGCGVMLLLGACRVVRVAKLLRNCRPVTSSSVLALWNDICASRNFSRRVQMLHCDQVAIPACLGGRRPAIIIPTRSSNLSNLRFALQHELEHLRQHDWIIAAVQSLVQMMFWFHPLVWLASRAVDHDRESSCDALVVRATNQPHSYAMALLAYCERQTGLHHPIAASLAGLGSKNTLSRRLHMIAHAHRSMNRSQRLLALAASLSLAIVGVLAQVTLAAAARQDADKKEDPQAVEIKTVAQDAGVIKKVQIDAPGGDRDPSTLLSVLEMQGHPMTEGSLTDQETIASAWKATVERNIVTAQQLNLSLPEGSKLKAVIWGDRVTITRDEAKSQIAAANGRIELIDADGVRRVTLRAAAPATNLALTASIENGEVAFVASSPDKNATLRLEFDRTTGVPENEEQPPHGAVRYDIQPANDDEDKPTRLKMQWIYDVSKLREQANALQLQRRIDEVQFQAVLVDATVMITADVRSIRRALPLPITIPAPEKDDE